MRIKNADLLVLKKTDINKVLNNYKNIWKNILNIKKHNLLGIKKKLIKIFLDYFEINGIKTKDANTGIPYLSPLSSPKCPIYNIKEKNKLFSKLMKKKNLKKIDLFQSDISINLKNAKEQPEIETIKTKSEKNIYNYIKMKTKILEEEEENNKSEKEKKKMKSMKNHLQIILK